MGEDAAWRSALSDAGVPRNLRVAGAVRLSCPFAPLIAQRVQCGRLRLATARAHSVRTRPGHPPACEGIVASTRAAPALQHSDARSGGPLAVASPLPGRVPCIGAGPERLAAFKGAPKC